MHPSTGSHKTSTPAGDWPGSDQQAEETLRLALDTGRLGIWNWSIPDDRITRGGYHEQLFGLAPGSFAGTYEEFLACVHPEDREPVKREVARCLELREEYCQEYRVLWPDGTEHWIEGRARFHFDSRGQPVRMIGVVQDITPRKLMEQHQARFQALFEAAQDAVLIADDERRYVDANPAASALFGVQRENLRGRRVDEFIEDVKGDSVDNAWQNFQVEGIQRGECRLLRPDHTEHHLEYSARANFAPGLHLSILRDVTERKKAEEAVLRQTAELQQFAYVASHDLQEPLRAIVSFSQMLMKRYQGQLDQEADQFLGYITAGAHRMKDLIDSLLAYSQVSHLQPVGHAAVALETPLHWATVNLETLIRETGATVTHDELPLVKADHVQWVQLFQNLIDNAIKYRKPGLPPRIHVSATESGREWVVSVRDNGIGIEKTHRELIFGVFKRLHGKDIPGTGIGLAICKRIIERSGGRIWVESDPGHGSTFKLAIPR